MRIDTRSCARAGLIVAALIRAGGAFAAAPEPAATVPKASAGVAVAKPLGAAPTTGAAQEAPPAGWSSGAAAQLTRLEEQTVLLKAEIRKLDAQAEVAQRTAALARLGSAATIDPVAQNVRVIAIEGFGHRYTAIVQTGIGERFDVASGDELPNGMKIVSIGANEVVGRWGNGQKMRMVPVLASRSGAVFNGGPNPAANGAANTGVAMGGGAPAGTLVPAVDPAAAAAGLPPAYQPAQ
ncbi:MULTISPECIES: type IV pilus biogenesis protein PilP [Burkholderia cepacia complex]|uniref:Type IV pilus biogenesis protein PilP n=1 Tax=Burkholderia orbicola (strain MC0-3) TaxID=406425 RepID=B1K4T7_BURO0|nr:MULTISPECIES: type IV pilus biogenesis protein PilP [Burkholderia cepacia complex]ACA95032.1 conserved hypothetical protein [Burkholderia orbicola MC0-3]MBR8157577.1 type IV pilus biogenesis protein PilP [Burkholderia cenocepacia]MBR8415454.1 type IV pilus biogenesis protein PilP [Burkholderia cenocepacia]MCA7922203.1 type IV pilus biogenesis protein PilP [Burkholderia cenocepacia]MCA8084646.1 type IV pilus biogenesis protein PilP [Burkholderia cenocepacia]